MNWVGCGDLVEPLGLGLQTSANWCRDPVIPADVDEIGIIACDGDLDRVMLDRRLRAAGHDPFAVAVVVLSSRDAEDPGWVAARMAGAAALPAASPVVGSEHLKLVVPTEVSRRTLLSLRKPTYRSVPRPDAQLCRAEDGCRACVGVCPHAALVWSNGAIQHDRLACAGCGRCVTACPVGAMINPAFTGEQFASQVRAWADSLARVFGVEVRCARAPGAPSPPPWMPLAVPCVAMVPPHWFVEILLAGASGVYVRDCACGLEADAADRTERNVSAARELLTAAGLGEGRIARSLDAPLGERLDAVAPEMLSSGSASLAGVFAPIRWEHGLAAAGVVTIDAEPCTGCEMCATACPPRALTIDRRDDGIAIDFDAGLCTGCGQCVERCPEPGAISMRSILDDEEVRRGRRTLVTHAVRRCVKCNGPVATVAVLERLSATLGDDPAFGQISSVCLDCRGMTMIF